MRGLPYMRSETPDFVIVRTPCMAMFVFNCRAAICIQKRRQQGPSHDLNRGALSQTLIIIEPESWGLWWHLV